MFCFCINWYCLCCHDTGLTWNSKYKVIYWKMKSFPSYCLFSVEDVPSNAVNFSLYLLDKSMWLHPIRKGIFNIKLGYYTLLILYELIVVNLKVLCYHDLMLVWFIYSCAISPYHYSKVITPNIRACRWFTSGTSGFFHH